ncbi:hypothetical protein [Bradyrhizobium viridifuturi]|uniref:hypothetical protein n=1 Tax=Bradyrhizobium viridifuturi TaxID=1654716 RepID=UPI003221DD70
MYIVKGTIELQACFAFMSEPLPILVEKSIQIAWDFLERSGEITDAATRAASFSEVSTTWRGLGSIGR